MEQKPHLMPIAWRVSWILILVSTAQYARAADVYWVPDTDGQWTAAPNWSSAPALPGVSDDVTISLPGDRLITLSGAPTETVNSLSSDERLLISQATIEAKTLQLSNKLTLTNGGTIRGGTYTATGPAVLSIQQQGTLDGMTVNSAIDVTTVTDSRLWVLNGLTLNGTIGVGSAGGETRGYVSFGQNGAAAGTLGGTGTVIFGGSLDNSLGNSSNQLGADGTLTIGKGITVRGNGGEISNSYVTGMIRNQGTISADVADGQITIGSRASGSGIGTFVNEGTLSAAAGGTLAINGAWSNAAGGTVTATGATLKLGNLNDRWQSAGAIVATDSTVNLGGTFSQPKNFMRTGGTVNLVGTLMGDLALDATTGSWVLSNNGTVRNGRYTATGGSSLIVENGTLDGVAVSSGAVVNLTKSYDSTLNVVNGLALDGTINLGSADGSARGALWVGFASALTGSGSVQFVGGGNEIINYSNGAMTIGPELTIHGKGAGISNEYATGSILNFGTINADVAGGGITVGGLGKFINHGTVSVGNGGTLTLQGTWSGDGRLVLNGGTLNLGGTFSQATYGTLERSGGTVNVTGLLTGDLSLDGTTGSWNLAYGSTVRDSVYTASGGAALIVQDSTLDRVTANGTVDLTTATNGRLRVLNGMTLNGTLAVGALDRMRYTQVIFGDTAMPAGTLGGTGTVVFGLADSIQNASTQIGDAGTLTIGSGVTIRGTNDGIYNDAASGTILNLGTIRAEVGGGGMSIGSSVGSFTNRGTVTAMNGGQLSLNGVWHNGPSGLVVATASTLNLGTNAYAWDNAGSITVTNSTVNLGGAFSRTTLGTFVRTGGTVNIIGTLSGDLALDGSTGSWNLTSSGTLRNGTYTATDGAALQINNGTLDGVTVNTPLAVPAPASGLHGTALYALNRLTLNDVLNLGNADGSSNGAIQFGRYGKAAGMLTGTGTIILGASSSPNGLVNNSDQAGAAGTLTIDDGITIRGKNGRISNEYYANTTILNRGTISADVAGGTITITNRFVNQGTTSASNGGTLALTGPWTNTGVVTVNNGALSLTGPMSGSGPVALNAATLSLIADGDNSTPALDNITLTGDTSVKLSRSRVGSVTFHIVRMNLGAGRLSVANAVAGCALEIGDIGLTGTATLDLSQPVSVIGVIGQEAPGRGITKSGGSAKLTFAGTSANTYTGLTRVDSGALDLNKSDGVIAVPGDLSVLGATVTQLAGGQIAPTSNVVASNSGAVLDLGGHSQTLASLSINNSAQVLMRPTAGASITAVNAGTAVLRVNGPLAFSGRGVLNIGNNQLIVDYDSAGASPMATVRAALTTGYTDSTWQGPGINATVIGSDRGLGYAEAGEILGTMGGTFAGQAVDGSAVLVRYTLSGDANLDGVVDFLDLARLAQNYNVTDGARTWAMGDYNYDGNVDFMDLAKLAQNYNTSLPMSPPVPGAPADFQDDFARAFASVPEPSLSLLVCAMGLCAMSGRPQRARP